MDTNRWGATYSVDGSFSGNLVSETGGSYKLYNLGTEGDADTEFLEIAYTGTGAGSKGIISVGSTGAGADRELILAGNSFRIRGGGGVGDRFYVDGNSILFQIDGKVSNGVDFYPTAVTATNTSTLGIPNNRWANLYSVAGNFSGTITNTATSGWAATFDRGINVGTDSGISWYYGNGNQTKFSTPVFFESSFQFGRAADGIASRVYRFQKNASELSFSPVDSGNASSPIFTIEDASSTFIMERLGGFVNHYANNAGEQAYRMYNLGEEGDADTEFGYIKHESNILRIGVDATGSGSKSRPVNFYTDSSFGFKATGGSTRFNISSSNVVTYLSILPNIDKARNIGSTSSKFARAYVNGGTFADVETITAASDSLVTTDHTVLCDCTSNSIALAIPASSVQQGNNYVIKKIDSTANTVTITPDSPATIDGAASQTLNFQHQSITLVSDGSNWFIV